MSDQPERTDEPDWTSIVDAYGDASNVPAMLNDTLSGDPTTRRSAIERLWGSLCHQGTVYEATPVAVRFIAKLIAEGTTTDDVRAHLTFLLASIANADSFVLPGNDQMVRADWRRDTDEPRPERDLIEECRTAVVAVAPQLIGLLPTAPPAMRGGLIALAGSVAQELPEEVEPIISDFANQANDRNLAESALLVMSILRDDHITAQQLREGADAELRDYLDAIADWPITIQVREAIRELAERASNPWLD
jgi:hypothetical protein